MPVAETGRNSTTLDSNSTRPGKYPIEQGPLTSQQAEFVDAIADFVGNKANRFKNDLDGSITAAMILAAIAHKDEMRKNGIDPYLSHCLAVSAILKAMMEQSGEAIDADKLVIAFLHDTLESLIKKIVKNYEKETDDSSEADLNITLRLINEIFSKITGDRNSTVEPDRAYIIGCGIVALTKYDTVTNIEIEPERYKEISFGDPSVALIKIADNLHNWSQPVQSEDPSKMKRAEEARRRYIDNLVLIFETGTSQDLSLWLHANGIDGTDRKQYSQDLNSKLAVVIEKILTDSWPDFKSFFDNPSVQALLGQYGADKTLPDSIPFGRPRNGGANQGLAMIA